MTEEKLKKIYPTFLKVFLFSGIFMIIFISLEYFFIGEKFIIQTTLIYLSLMLIVLFSLLFIGIKK
jgi:hypothetical protein